MIAALAANGGSSTGLVVLESSVFVLGVVVLGAALVWWGRRIFNEK